MQVGRLASVAILGVWRGEPTAVLAIAQRATQGRHTVFNPFGIPRQPHGMGHGETVGHAGGVHGFGAGTGRKAAFIVQVAEPVRQTGRLGE